MYSCVYSVYSVVQLKCADSHFTAYIAFQQFLGPIGPLELGLSVGLLEVFIENLLNLHWGPLDDSRMGNGEWGMGIEN